MRDIPVHGRPACHDRIREGGGEMTFGITVLAVVIVWSAVSIVASVSFGAIAQRRDTTTADASTTADTRRRLAS